MTIFDPRPVHQEIRNLLFPIFNWKQGGLLIIILGLCISYGLLLSDIIATLTTAFVAIISMWITLWPDVPYCISIDVKSAEKVRKSLNNIKLLKTVDEMTWRRNGILATSSDNIRIEQNDKHATLYGRKRDVLGIAKHMRLHMIEE